MMHNIIAVIILLCVVVFFRLYEPKTAQISTEIIVDTAAIVHEDSAHKSIPTERYAVNPNTASLDELLHAGFSKQQAFTLIKYRKAGGTFRYREDIAKLYTVSAADYAQLREYIDLPEKSAKSNTAKTNAQNTSYSSYEKSKNARPQYEKKAIVKQDLNTIDSAALVKIPLIGAFRAQKIVDARKKWGGFYSMAQLALLYSFDSAACANVATYCYIDTLHIRRVDLNTCSFKEIQNLPQSSYYVAKRIFDYKRIVGAIHNPSELLEHNIIEPEKFAVLRYYITAN
ncbi:MAG: helix-hairpin-helix domain-containing protein [Bacteroidales bacterium]|nr:helix-hairpin-helix domain-containing protein [Bacteroidales bacterium]